jgi:hypothetical protein
VTPAQLERAIARATGEALPTIRRLGFSAATGPAIDLEPEDVALVLDCPFCGRPVAYPGTTGVGALALAECLRCDVIYEFDTAEVYVAGRDRLTRVA